MKQLQAFEGVVIAIKNRGLNSTAFTVRKISSGVGVERVFQPLPNRAANEVKPSWCGTSC